MSSVLLACDIADFAGRIGTGMKIGRIMNSFKEENMKMRLTGHLGGHLLGDGVVHVLPLAGHNIVDIPLADKDDEHPNSLKRSSLVKAAAASFDPGHLAHVQGVSEDHPTRIGLKSSEGEVEDLKVPGDAHPKEEPDVDQHLVPFDADLAVASAVRARTTK